jgi:uncharacterized iron-regulated membrane protein
MNPAPETPTLRAGRMLLAGLVWAHRWSGVIACLLFAVWFATGAVMVFKPFPSLSAGVRAARSEMIDLTKVTVTPGEALAAADGATGLRLISRAGRPVYVVAMPDGPPQVIAADGGVGAAKITADEALLIAEAFEGRAARIAFGPVVDDQWTVHQAMDPLRPFYRVRFDDGEDLYISARTGEAAQRTGRAERAWNYGGAVLHWIYMTPLRRHWAAWDQTVWWISLGCVFVAAAGVALGVIRSTQSLRRRGLWSPFRGWMQWHHLLGFCGGVLAFTWIVSGWLSMDHGRLFSTSDVPQQTVTQAAGLGIAPAATAFSVTDLDGLAGSSRIEFGAVAGQPLASGFGVQQAVLLQGPGGLVQADRIPGSVIAKAVQAAWPDTRATIAPSPADDFYRVAEELSDDAVLAVREDGSGLRLYIDPQRGALLAQVDRSRAAYAWWYYALHTFKLPAVTGTPGLWTVAISLPLLLGFGFSVTGVVIGWRRLVIAARSTGGS